MPHNTEIASSWNMDRMKNKKKYQYKMKTEDN